MVWLAKASRVTRNFGSAGVGLLASVLVATFQPAKLVLKAAVLQKSCAPSGK